MANATAANIINRRYDFLYLFDVRDGNPNGDPDFANTPRFDPETFEGLVSDVCLKRKIRDYVYALKSQGGSVQNGYDLFILEGGSLESRQKLAYDAGKLKPKSREAKDIEVARAFMCERFFDVRAFGAVMSTTDFNCGQVRGPVQLTFARSFDRVLQTEHGITRLVHTTEKLQKEKGPAGTMGNKHTIAYGLYRAAGFINPSFAQRTGFTEDDLQVLWTGMVNMLGNADASAARGLMAARHLFVFEHETALGQAPAHKLFELIEDAIARRDADRPPRRFADYAIPDLQTIRAKLPPGIALKDMVNPNA